MGFVCAEQVHVQMESLFFLKKLCERGGGEMQRHISTVCTDR